MDYDKQIKKWAAAKLLIQPWDIEDVEFEVEDGHWYSEYTYDEGYAIADVTLLDGRSLEIKLDRTDFGATIREIMEA